MSDKIECWAVTYEYNMAAFLLPERGWVPKIVFFEEESKAKSFSETARSDYYRSISAPIRMVPESELIEARALLNRAARIVADYEALSEQYEPTTGVDDREECRAILTALESPARGEEE